MKVNRVKVTYGRPCPHSAGGGCQIYDKRPVDPCRNFVCAWVANGSPFPDWMRPDQSRVIVQFNKYLWRDRPVDIAVSVGDTIPGASLAWLVQFQREHQRLLIITERVQPAVGAKPKTSLKVLGTDAFQKDIGELIRNGRFSLENVHLGKKGASGGLAKTAVNFPGTGSSVRNQSTPSLNQLCPCGSGKQYSQCCKLQKAQLPQPPIVPLAQPKPGNAQSLSKSLRDAVEHHQAGRLDEAEGLYRAMLQVEPNHADALHLLGVVNHQLARNEQARELIHKAIMLNPQAAEYHNNLGEVCRAMHSLDEARHCFSKAISLRPDFAEPHRNLALVELEEGNPAQAISLLQASMERFPDYLGIYQALGDAYLSRQEFLKAMSAYEQGLSKDPANATLLCSKGIALKVAGRLDDAIAHYKKAIALNPAVPELHHNLSLILIKTHQYSDAADCLERLIELRPADESSSHLVAAFRNVTTDRAPASYVRELFDQYAEKFDRHLGALEYRTPQLLADMLRGVLMDGARLQNALDLGCGTGLFGAEIRDICTRILGIDLAPRMIEKARARGVYDQLVEADILEYLSSAQSGQFDLISATDVFIYIGNLTPVFQQASRVLVPGGWLAFSIEVAPSEKTDYFLDKTGRYQQKLDYIRRVLRELDFEERGFGPVVLRKESDRPVEGCICLFSKL